MTSTEQALRAPNRHLITDIRNDALRRALDAFARKAVPFLRHDDAYYSDLLWDAETMARMEVGDEVFFLVRGYGTNAFHPEHQNPESIAKKREEVIAHCDPRYNDGRAVLRVVREPYDSFVVSVVHHITS